jgi:hypothetical protein
MRYWLSWSVALGLIYTGVSAVLGDELMVQAFDVRMDHYTRTSLMKETPHWLREATENSTASYSTDPNMWNSVRVIELDDNRRIEIPRAGFLAWHLIWSLLFLLILVVDRFQSRCFCRGPRGRWVWAFARTWLAFGVMFLDLLITSFLNPSVTRFMMFVYALLIRVQFVQTIVLCFLSSAALLGAGYIGSHEFLNSISVAEFLVLNLVCLSAARQTEIHARLSLYRLWYIMVKNKGQHGGREVHENISEVELARNVLSLTELALEPILEEGPEELDTEGLPPPPDAETANRCVDETSDSTSHSGGTPYSHSVSIGSCALDPKPQAPVRRPSITLLFDRTNSGGSGASKKKSRRGSGSKKHRSGTVSPASSDSDTDNRSECGSFCSDFVMDQTRLSPWLCIDGKEVMRQYAHDDFDAINGWAEVPDVERYELRGPTYLTDGVKIPAQPSAFQVHQVRIVKTKDALLHAAEKLPSLNSFLKSHPKHFFFIYNRVVPHGRSSVMNVITLMCRRMPINEDKAFDQLFGRYVTGDDVFKNNRLKYLYKIRDAPAAVHTALRAFGKERPVIIGNKGHMDQQNFTGNNYVEVDIDTSSSWLARMVVGKINANAAKIVIEEMLVLEGQAESELPERPLAAWQWLHITPDQVLVDQENLEAPAAPGESSEGDIGVHPALTRL